MKKLFFIVISLFCLIGNVLAKDNEPLKLVSIVNKCSVIKDNTIVVPVRVITKNSGTLTNLIDEYTLGYIDNNKDIVKVRLTDINGVSNVTLDNKRDSNGRSLIRFYIEKDLSANKLDNVFSFNIQVEFTHKVPDTYYVLGTEIVISDKEVCEEVNGYKINEIEKIKYIDFSKVDHTEMINDLIVKVVIGLLVVTIIILVFLLIRKKK